MSKDSFEPAESFDLAALKRKRAAVKGVITKISNAVSDSGASLDNQALKVREERLRASFVKWEDLNLEIVAMDPEAPEDNVESTYLDALTQIGRLLTPVKESLSTQVSKQKIKLPNVAIPIFNGKYRDYQAFIGLFDALIHKNNNLEDIEKLFYLQSYLQDEPRDLIKNLPMCKESYDEARKILDDRYNNKYKITNDHINILLELTPMTKSTAANIRNYLSVVKQQLAALRNLGHSVEQWDPLILCILTKKLDMICNREFELGRQQQPSVTSVIEFLEKRALALENVEREKVASAPKAVHVATVKNLQPVSTAKKSCLLCKSMHKLFNCSKFKLMPVNDRIEFVTANNICRICLNNHNKPCRYNFKCKVCKSSHNSLLHEEETPSPVTLVAGSTSEQVLLPTAQVKLLASNGTEVHVKALLDTGSQVSFVTKELANLLQLQIQATNTPVTGIGQSYSNLKEKVNLQLHSLSQDFKISVSCYLLDKITSRLPQKSFNIQNLVLPPNIVLADMKFNEPSNIHILLGADVVFQVLLPPDPSIQSSQEEHANIIASTSSPSLPPLLNTKFGYIIAVCSTTGISEPTADHGHNTSLSTLRTNSISRVNFQTSMVSLEEGSSIRLFFGSRGTDLQDEESHRRVKRSDDRCLAFMYLDKDQKKIEHPHPRDNPNNQNYYRKIDCVTVINGTEGSILELTFVDIFRIEYHPDCEYDYLEIRDGSRGYAPLLGGKKLCGEQFPRPIQTTGPYAWLKFHSDDTIEYEGFHINIEMMSSAKSHSVPESCTHELTAVDGILDIRTINQKCKDDSQAYDILWKITAKPKYKIYLNFTSFDLAKPNSCEENVVQVFGSIVEFDSKLAHYCGSIANSVVTKADTTKTPNDPGNVMHVRLYASKSAKTATKFQAHYTVFRTLDSTGDNVNCLEDEFDCQDSTCISMDLKCNSYANCRLKADEDQDLCKEAAKSMISEPHILVILVIFSLILSGMTFVFLFKCFRKLYQDHKIIKEHIRQSCEDGLDSLAERRLTLDAKRLERDSEPRASLERDNHTNEMFKKQRSFSKQKQGSIDSDFQETHLDLDDEPWRREVDSVPIETEEIRVERNGRTRRSDLSKKEESIRSKRESEERREKKEIRDVSVGAPDTKESGCQTRESLFQTDPPPSSDGSGSNSRGFSTFGYSGATIVRPSPPPLTTASEITIELLSQVTPPEPVKQKKIPDRRPMSTETTRSAPDVIIVSKPIR